MDEKKVELTDEEIVKALKKQPPRDTVLWLEKGINATDILDLIHRLQEENEKLKTLVSHFEQLEKQLSDKIEQLTEENEILKGNHRRRKWNISD